MMELTFIRHGATAGNLERRYIGRTDEPLCAAGIAQAEALRDKLQKPDVLFVSPLLRTRQTAGILFPGVSPIIEPGFAETDFGLFEGKTAAELADCGEYRAWVDAGCRGPIPGGEQVDQFKARCRAAFAGAVSALPDGCRAAFVLHGGVIMAILEAYALPHRDFYAYHLRNGEALQGRYDQGALFLEQT